MAVAAVVVPDNVLLSVSIAKAVFLAADETTGGKRARWKNETRRDLRGRCISSRSTPRAGFNAPSAQAGIVAGKLRLREMRRLLMVPVIFVSDG
jgi:hypothetical protein